MLDSDFEGDVIGLEPSEPSFTDKFPVSQQAGDLAWAKDPQKPLEQLDALVGIGVALLARKH